MSTVNLWKIPFNPSHSTSAISTLGPTSAYLDAESEKEGWIFRVPRSMTITHLGVRFVGYAGTPPTYRISLQGVSGSNGTPDGSIKGSGACYTTFTPPANSSWNNTFQWFQLNTSYDASPGELLSYVMDWYSGTIDASNRSHVCEYWSGNIDGVPYAANYVSSWVKRAYTPSFGYKDGSSPTYVFGQPSIQTSYGATLGANGDRAALKFSLPSWFCSSAKICGARLMLSSEGAGQSAKFGLWDSSGVLQDITLDSDVFAYPSSSHQLVEVYFDEASLSTLSADTTYYLGIERVAASTTLYELANYTASDLKAFPMGDSWIRSVYSSGAWTDTNTNRPLVSPIFADITAPAGTSGLLVHPGMVGGMRA